MTENEKQVILASLEKGADALLSAVNGVTDELAVRVSTPVRWSILQCVEHVSLAEDYLFFLIKTAKRTDLPLVNEQREILIATRGADRSVKRESPPYALPKGQFSTLHEALQGFIVSRERTIQFVKTNEEDLHYRIAAHPIIGTVNCYEVLLLMAVHPARHAKQIEESKAVLAS
ncbi:MAG: DinB family protein [Terracidiphilus sp.]|jgi:hypothetical protein